MNKNKFILPNAIPYVNAKPHIGHAMEFVQSDTIARFHKQQGEEVLLLCGADECFKKRSGRRTGKISVQELVDRNSKLFEELAKN